MIVYLLVNGKIIVDNFLEIKPEDEVFFVAYNKSNEVETITITIDGINTITGRHETIENSIYKTVKPKTRKVIDRWYLIDEKFKFTQKFSDYSFANDCDPNNRGVISLLINKTTMVEYFYNNYNKKKIPKGFK